MSWLGFLMNPAMLGLGAIAIASPILIHLLNKRRFKIVDWAAMDFLLEADKKNRRRVHSSRRLSSSQGLALVSCRSRLQRGEASRPLTKDTALARVTADDRLRVTK